MKIIILLLILFICLPLMAEEINTFEGMVEHISKAISSEGGGAKIDVVSDNGEKETFFVFGNNPVLDKDGNDMSKGGQKIGGLRLKKGERVSISYKTITDGTAITEGQNGAVSIHCLD